LVVAKVHYSLFLLLIAAVVTENAAASSASVELSNTVAVDQQAPLNSGGDGEVATEGAY
jgi:hypothetical protein